MRAMTMTNRVNKPFSRHIGDIQREVETERIPPAYPISSSVHDLRYNVQGNHRFPLIPSNDGHSAPRQVKFVLKRICLFVKYFVLYFQVI